MNVRLILTLILALVPGCGSSDPRALTDEGAKAWGSGKWEESAQSYEEALAALGSDTTNPEWKRAKLGLIQAHTRTDAAMAKSEFLEFAKEEFERDYGPEKMEAMNQEYRLLGLIDPDLELYRTILDLLESQALIEAQGGVEALHMDRHRLAGRGAASQNVFEQR